MTKSKSQSSRQIDVLVGERIRAQRLHLGMTRADLAESIGISVQQLHKYETGMSTVTASGLYRLARRLSVPPAFFFEKLPAPNLPSAAEAEIALHAPNTQEMRQMLDAYRAIVKPDVRQQIVELARSLAAPRAPRSSR